MRLNIIHFILLFLFSSCSDMCLRNREEIGRFNLDGDELKLIPYTAGDSIFFKDHDGNILTFVVSEIDKRFINNCGGAEDCCEYYAEEAIWFKLSRIDKPVSFQFNLRKGRSHRFEKGETEFLIEYNNALHYYLNDLSSTPAPENYHQVPPTIHNSYEVQGKTYDEVFAFPSTISNNLSFNHDSLYYNREKGVLKFSMWNDTIVSFDMELVP